MHRPESQLLEPAEQGRRRRRSGDTHDDRTRELVRLRIVHDADVDGRRAVVVGDAFLVDHLPDARGLDPPQTDVRAADRRHAPGEAPAVAVEHRQGPQIPSVEAHLRLEHLAERVDPRSPMRIHDTLGPARRARGVVDRKHLFFVLQPALDRRRRAAGEKILVRISGVTGVVHAHDAQAGERQRLHQRLELGVDEEELRAGVLEDVADLVRAEPRIDGDQHASRGRHAVVRLEHRRNVRAEKCHPVVLVHTGRAQRRGKPIHALLELPVGIAAHAMHDRGLVGEDVGAPREEAQRR